MKMLPIWSFRILSNHNRRKDLHHRGRGHRLRHPYRAWNLVTKNWKKLKSSFFADISSKFHDFHENFRFRCKIDFYFIFKIRNLIFSYWSSFASDPCPRCWWCHQAWCGQAWEAPVLFFGKLKKNNHKNLKSAPEISFLINYFQKLEISKLFVPHSRTHPVSTSKSPR